MADFSFGQMFGLAAASKGLDLTNSLGTTLFSNYLGRKNEKKSLARQYAYAQRYAVNSPSWTVEGLRKANLNPILAATDGAFSSPTVPSASYNSPSSSGGSPIDLLGTFINAQAVESQKSLQGSQESLNYVRAINELKNMGFSGSPAVAARLFSELVGTDVLKGNDAKEAFEKFWNGINPPNSTTHTTSLSTPNGSTTPSHETKSLHHPSVEPPKNWSDDTPYGRFGNRLDREVHKQRQERSLRNHRTKKPYKNNQSNPPSIWFR